MTQIKIDKGVPVPDRAERHRYPFRRMEVGDSFVVDISFHRVSNAAYSYGYKTGKQFTVRHTASGTRVWRVA